MKRPLLVLVACCIVAACVGCASTGDKARNAALADIGTTGIGLAMGAAELNPLGLLTIPLKYGILAHAKTLPDGQRQDMETTAAAVWTGFSANNVCVIVAIATGGAFATACLVLGAGVAYQQWIASEEERQFWFICSVEREVNPLISCDWKS